MLHRLPIVLAQAKAGNSFDQICQINPITINYELIIKTMTKNKMQDAVII